MQDNYERDLDLNLLRVFCVVADAGSVTQAASRLYLTQPAVSAALRRLTRAIGAPLFVREGRRLVLSSRGSALRSRAQPHLAALVEAALTPAAFEPLRSERVMRLGLSEGAETWLLPRLLRVLEARAPRMRLIVVPVQFRTVADALATGQVELAVTVADPLPAAVRRQPLFWGDFVCLYDSRLVRLGARGRLSERDYFDHEHVIVSYNADLRGIVEDALQKTRRSRCSVSSFANVAAIVEGSALLATVPRKLALEASERRPHLKSAELPFRLPGATTDLLWPSAADDDDACRFMRQCVLDAIGPAKAPSRRSRPSRSAARARS
jgi:LysR family transcriptional activator of mexEF-oprN operon